MIYVLSTRVDLIFSVQKLAKFSEKPGKENFEGLVHLLRYIRDNKNLGLKYYSDMNDAPITDLLRQARIKNENRLMDFMILVGNIVQTLAEVQEHILYFIKVGQLTMSHMFHHQLLNQVQKISTMQHAQQEWLLDISGC